MTLLVKWSLITNDGVRKSDTMPYSCRTGGNEYFWENRKVHVILGDKCGVPILLG